MLFFFKLLKTCTSFAKLTYFYRQTKQHVILAEGWSMQVLGAGLGGPGACNRRQSSLLKGTLK